MSNRKCTLRLVMALVVVVLGTGAFAQDTGPDPVVENAGTSLFPSESTRGIEAILDQLAEPDEAGLQSLEELLSPANTNSPRDTIVSFLKRTQRYYDLLQQDTYTVEDDAELQHLYDEMQWFFDLRNVAPSLRNRTTHRRPKEIRIVGRSEQRGIRTRPSITRTGRHTSSSTRSTPTPSTSRSRTGTARQTIGPIWSTAR